MVQIPGWFSKEAARASRQNRSIAAGSASVASSKTLRATVRPSFLVLRGIHDTHAAAAKPAEDLVVPEGRTCDQFLHPTIMQGGCRGGKLWCGLCGGESPSPSGLG